MTSKFNINHAMKFILIWVFCGSAIAVNLNKIDITKIKNTNLIAPNLISDNSINELLSGNLINFVHLYNKYNNVVSLQSIEKQSFVEINNSLHNLDIIEIQSLLTNSSLSVSKLKKLGIIQDIDKNNIITKIKSKIKSCIKGDICNSIDSALPVDIALSEIAINLNNNRIYSQLMNQDDSYFELVMFTNSNYMFGNNNVAYVVSFSELVFDNWLSIINSNDSFNLEKELLEHNKALYKPCLIKSSPYCLIDNNRKNKLIEFIRKQQSLDTPSLKLYLLIDFAIKTKNEKMALFLNQQDLGSIYFTTQQSMLYATSANNLVKLTDVILEDDNINIEYLYDIGLTPLGAAIGQNSLDVISLLIDKGAITTGNIFVKTYSGYPPKVLDKDNYYLFELLAGKYAIKEDIPELLNTIILRHISDGEQQLNWLKTMLNKRHSLYKILFIQNEEFSRRVLIESLKLINPKIFDFFIKNGIKLCLAFDSAAMKSIDSRRIKDESLWLNARYKTYLDKCENSIKKN